MGKDLPQSTPLWLVSFALPIILLCCRAATLPHLYRLPARYPADPISRLNAGNNSQLTTISSGGQASTFSSTPDGPLALQIATEIAENEISHVRYLRKALTAAGATPVSLHSLPSDKVRPF